MERSSGYVSADIQRAEKKLNLADIQLPDGPVNYE